MPADPHLGMFKNIGKILFLKMMKIIDPFPISSTNYPLPRISAYMNMMIKSSLLLSIMVCT